MILLCSFYFLEFVNFDKTLEEKLNDIVKQLARKSNIKDVCALLDMKSSKWETLHFCLISVIF